MGGSGVAPGLDLASIGNEWGRSLPVVRIRDAGSTDFASRRARTLNPVRPWVAPRTRTGNVESDVQAVMNSQVPPDPPKQRFATGSGTLTAGSRRDGAMGVAIRSITNQGVNRSHIRVSGIVRSSSTVKYEYGK